MNKFARVVRQSRVAVSAALATVGGSAMAALPVGAEAAIAGVGTDVVEAIGFVILAGITIYAAKKLGQKMGWL